MASTLRKTSATVRGQDGSGNGGVFVASATVGSLDDNGDVDSERKGRIFRDRVVKKREEIMLRMPRSLYTFHGDEDKPHYTYHQRLLHRMRNQGGAFEVGDDVEVTGYDEYLDDVDDEDALMKRLGMSDGVGGPALQRSSRRRKRCLTSGPEIGRGYRQMGVGKRVSHLGEGGDEEEAPDSDASDGEFIVTSDGMVTENPMRNIGRELKYAWGPFTPPAFNSLYPPICTPCYTPGYTPGYTPEVGGERCTVGVYDSHYLPTNTHTRSFLGPYKYPPEIRKPVRGAKFVSMAVDRVVSIPRLPPLPFQQAAIGEESGAKDETRHHQPSMYGSNRYGYDRQEYSGTPRISEDLDRCFSFDIRQSLEKEYRIASLSPESSLSTPSLPSRQHAEQLTAHTTRDDTVTGSSQGLINVNIVIPKEQFKNLDLDENTLSSSFSKCVKGQELAPKTLREAMRQGKIMWRNEWVKQQMREDYITFFLRRGHEQNEARWALDYLNGKSCHVDPGAASWDGGTSGNDDFFGKHHQYGEYPPLPSRSKRRPLVSQKPAESLRSEESAPENEVLPEGADDEEADDDNCDDSWLRILRERKKKNLLDGEDETHYHSHLIKLIEARSGLLPNLFPERRASSRKHPKDCVVRLGRLVQYGEKIEQLTRCPLLQMEMQREMRKGWREPGVSEGVVRHMQPPRGTRKESEKYQVTKEQLAKMEKQIKEGRRKVQEAEGRGREPDEADDEISFDAEQQEKRRAARKREPAKKLGGGRYAV